MRRPAKPQQRVFELMWLMSARFPTATNIYPPTQNSRTPRFEAASPEAAGPRTYACIAAWSLGLVETGLFCKPLDLDTLVGKRLPTAIAIVDRTWARTRKRQQPLICKPDLGNPAQASATVNVKARTRHSCARASNHRSASAAVSQAAAKRLVFFECVVLLVRLRPPGVRGGCFSNRC